ncbi:rRNA maturation RNase YbeY [Candidatus Aerophobetes bacterium]|uniref:Endoribonuclease YbeY n=1 Tax=Aerophobetes bacterium TaxID=2030807 RepID=A0A2A4X9M5_UNCAE|nr:MAG: rRNA maturation RNase YbeY [Candidatus Aerophobetes bacterium]
MLSVNTYNLQKDFPVDLPLMENVASLFCAKHCPSAISLDITFVDEEKSALLHGQYFNDKTPTDCMTFPVDTPESSEAVLGEIVICPSVAKKQAQEHKTYYKKEIARYLVHGLLHMLGYEDMTQQQQSIIRAQEDLFFTHLLEKKPLINKCLYAL